MTGANKMTDANKNPNQPTELELLLEALCEDRLSADEIARFEQLVLASPDAQWKYLTYLDLHGTLFWDAAGAGSAEPLTSHGDRVNAVPAAAIQKPEGSRRIRQTTAHLGKAMIACLLLMVIGVWQVTRMQNSASVIAPKPSFNETIGVVGTNRIQRKERRDYGPPIALVEPQVNPEVAGVNEQLSQTPVVAELKVTLPPLSNDEVIASINREIQARWTELDIRPSAKADDSEWLRRVYLDLIGRVPTVTEAEVFLADSGERKHTGLIETLLSDSAYIRNFTTKWTNLLIGRASNSQVNRESFEKFLRLSFAVNRPWNQIVAELISAEGNSVENGATNFLIAQLNNDATPATAVVSKLFLGRQIQCNQCHNNPFDESKQTEFWELNSFFQQTTAVARQRRDPKSGLLAYVATDLVTQDAGGPTYFETQSGLMRVAYPRFNGHPIDPSPDTNRRRELAQLMTGGEQPELAAAFVNRMWEHFFGSGFTRSVDNMGAHQPTSHPELVAFLSEQFVRSGYDIKQLIRWICESEPYQLTSRFSDSNQNDDPSLGELPAFSRMYVRSMTPEQTYDSFLTATKAHQVGAVDWTQAEKNRQQWLQQFVVAFNTDENDETMSFEGTIGNALSLMNGPLIEKALDISAGSFLGEVVRGKSSDSEKIGMLCLAAWSRRPSPTELSSMKRLVRDASTSRIGTASTNDAFQDLFWALLNSNEFVLVR